MNDIHHGHKHLEADLDPSWLHALFTFKPAHNALVAIVLSTLLTQTVLYAIPPLPEILQEFLVTFAAGGMLGNIFLHLLPEIQSSSSASDSITVVVEAFLAFVVFDKVCRQVTAYLGNGESSSHSHSHTHSHSHSHANSSPSIDHERHATTMSTATKVVENKGQKENQITHRRSASKPVQAPREESGEPGTAGDTGDAGLTLATILNVAADAMHNFADGLSLAIAFNGSTSDGIRAFIVMCCCEIPHQLADFALVVRNGTPKRTGMIAQLITACGTLLGAMASNLATTPTNSSSIFAWISQLQTNAQPITAGLFLYVVTIGILPEVLETSPSGSKVVFAQIGGLYMGLKLMSHLD